MQDATVEASEEESRRQREEALIRGFFKDYAAATIDEILKALGEMMAADRAYLFEADAIKGTITNTHEWCAPGAASQKALFQDSDSPDLRMVLDLVREKTVVSVRTLSDLAPDDPLRAFMRDICGVDSFILAPLVIAGELSGFLGVDSPRANQDMELLMTVIANSLCKEVLAERRIARNSEAYRVLDKVREQYATMYFVDFATDYMHTYKTNASYRGKYGETFRYSESMGGYVRHDVAEKDRVRMIEATEAANVMKRFEKEDSFLLNFEDASFDAPRYCQFRFIKANDAGTQAVICGADVTAEKLADDAMADQMSEQQRVIDALGSEYKTIYLVNATTRTFKMLRSCTGYYKEAIEACRTLSDYDTAARYYVDHYVYPEDRAYLLEQTSIDALRRNTPASGIHSITYRRLMGNAAVCHQFNSARVAGVKGQEFFVIGFRDIQKIVEDEKKKGEAQLAIFRGLSSNFLNVYLIDLGTDRATVLKLNGYVTSSIEASKNVYSYDKLYGQYVVERVHPEDQDRVREAFSREAIRKALAGAGEYTGNYRVLVDGETHYYQYRYVKLDGVDQIIAGYQNIDDIVAEEQRRKTAEDAMRDEMMRQMQIINALASSFLNVYRIDLKADRVTVLKLNGYVISSIEASRTVYSYDKLYGQYVAERVHPEDKAMVMEVFSRKAIRKALAASNGYTGTYRVLSEGETHYYQYRYEKIDGVDQVIVGYQNIDDIVAEEQRRKAAEDAMRDEMMRQMKVINALSSEYQNLYLIDVTTGCYQAIRAMRNGIHKKAVEQSLVDKNYEGALGIYIDHFVAEADREFLRSHLKREVLLAETPDEGIHSLEYHRVFDDAVRNYQMNTAKFTGDDGKQYIVLGFRDVSDMVEEERRRVKRIEAIASAYQTMVAIDFEKDAYAVIRGGGVSCKVNAAGPIAEVAELMRRRAGAADFKGDPEKEAFLDLAVMRDRLQTADEVKRDVKSPEGKWVSVHYIVSRRDAAGRVAEMLFAIQDIDAMKVRELEREAALRDALAVAEQSNRAKTTFLNSMSHDIRTPMNAIIGFTALAQTHIAEAEKVQDYLHKISTSSAHLLSLINDILDMSRIESGSVKLDEKPMHMPDLLHDLRSMIQSLINSKQQNLYIDTLDVKHEDVVADKLRLNQILINIVGNAVKFTSVGGDIMIRVAEKPCDKAGMATYEFMVKDNGIGMSKEFIPHIFDTFSREQSATVSGIQGTGLGMAITKNIVTMMGGDIRVESEKGKGSAFTITLDMHLSDVPIVVQPIPQLKGSRALVVDDDLNTCRSVCKMLREIEMRPQWTLSGKEAVVRAQDAVEEGDEYKVYIVDYLMPDMNGIETVRRIRKVAGDDAAIIVLTAYDWENFEAEAREAGVTAFVSKPIFMSELREVLSNPAGTPTAPEEAVIDRNFVGKRVLLVEDNELNCEIAVEILKTAGFEVETAGDGIEAIAAVNDAPEAHFDLVLMDVQMPRMDGYTATREIRTLKNNRKANVPIIAMTANAFNEDKQKAFACGMNGYITKPINLKEMEETLEAILQ